MKYRKISLVFFHDNKGNILIQDRKDISKFGEEYGFFGGGIEKDETPKQAVIREIIEELGIELTELKFFKKYYKEYEKLGVCADFFVFLSSIPPRNKIKVEEGKPAFLELNKFLNLKTMPWDMEIFKDIVKYLEKQNNLKTTNRT